MIGTAKEIFHAMETIARNSKMAVSWAKQSLPIEGYVVRKRMMPCCS